MFKAKHNRLFEGLFKIYLGIKFNKSFSDFKIIKDKAALNKPMVLIGNHYSWWDGFWVLMQNNKKWKKKLHVMMLEDQLKKNMILNKIGAFSINPGTKDQINTLNYAAEILSKKENMVLMYPQGIMNSVYKNTFEFNKGIEFILRKTNNEVNVNFAAFLIDYFDNSKPSVYAYFDHYQSSDHSLKSLETAYNKFYSECLNYQKSLTK